MKIAQRAVTMLLVSLLCFWAGYSFSARTGTEPGYFDAVEAAGYGGGGDEKIEGVSEEMQNFYKSLQEDE